MPRIPFEPDPQVEQVRAALRDYVAAKRGRQTLIEKATGVRQYTISRFISGRTRKLSPEIRSVCDYVGIQTDTGIEDPGDSARLQAALSKVWDGRPETAELLAALIESLGPVLQTMELHRIKAIRESEL